MPANLPLRYGDDHTNYLEDDLKLFEIFFELPLTRPINVRKQVLFNSQYFTTIPGGLVAGQMAGWRNMKIRLTQFNLNLNCQFELSFAITRNLPNISTYQQMKYKNFNCPKITNNNLGNNSTPLCKFQLGSLLMHVTGFNGIYPYRVRSVRE